jgi:hypothetical protein
MPEALALFAVLFVAVIIAAAMWVRARDPQLHRPHEEAARVEHQVEWLEERLAKARRENWGDEMVAGFRRELHAIRLRQGESGEGKSNRKSE